MSRSRVSVAVSIDYGGRMGPSTRRSIHATAVMLLLSSTIVGTSRADWITERTRDLVNDQLLQARADGILRSFWRVELVEDDELDHSSGWEDAIAAMTTDSLLPARPGSEESTCAGWRGIGVGLTIGN